ncbi:MAG: UDP-3-O-(3-hydroxymyristoyl)glucosamine N-acyltransferase [Pseudohongiellaceae bacterium]
MTQTHHYTLGDIATRLNVELVGDKDAVVTGMGTLKNADSSQLTFLSNVAYIDQLKNTKASAVILSRSHADSCPTNTLISKNPYLSFAQATALFDNSPLVPVGVHPSAIIAESATIGDRVSIAAHVVIEAGAHIESGVAIGSGCTIGANCEIGSNTRLHSNVTVYHQVCIGSNVVIHSGSVIGADGFGFAFDGEYSQKIHQLGGVLIGDNVDIGANTTIDRGALEDTVIGQGVKIDNQVQIGHNCVIGDHTVICGCVALAGSVTIGKYCIMGGASGAVGHITIADKTQVSAMSLVSQSITEPAMYSSGTGHMKTADWKRAIVRFQQLDGLAKRIKKLEQSDNNDGGTG